MIEHYSAARQPFYPVEGVTCMAKLSFLFKVLWKNKDPGMV